MQEVRIRFCDFTPSDVCIQDTRQVIIDLLSTRFKLIETDEPDVVLYSCFGTEYRSFDCLRIFYTGENIRPNFDECDFAFSFDETTDRNYRLPIYRVWHGFDQLTAPRDPAQLFAEKLPVLA